MNPEQMAQLQMMMGGAKKPEPWTKMVCIALKTLQSTSIYLVVIDNVLFRVWQKHQQASQSHLLVQFISGTLEALHQKEFKL